MVKWDEIWKPIVNALSKLECVWIEIIHGCVFNFTCFPFFFFFSAATVDPIFCEQCTNHCSWVPQTPLFNNFFIKNGSHGTIYIFKNYFAIVFSVFSKINCIKTDHKRVHDIFFLNMSDKFKIMYFTWSNLLHDLIDPTWLTIWLIRLVFNPIKMTCFYFNRNSGLVW